MDSRSPSPVFAFSVLGLPSAVELSSVLLRKLSHGADNSVDLSVAHLRKDRQRDNPLECGRRVGKISRLIAEAPFVKRMKMKRNEVHRRPDVFLFERFDELVAADAQPIEFQLYDVKMPSVLDIIPDYRPANLRHVGEPGVVQTGDSFSRLIEFLGSLELNQTKRRGQVGQIILVARIFDLVVPRSACGVALPGVLADAVQTHHAHALGPVRIGSRGHAAFTGGDCLGCVEREASNIAKRANHCPLVSRRQRMRGILDDS